MPSPNTLLRIRAEVEATLPNWKRCSPEFLLREVLRELRVANALSAGDHSALLLDSAPEAGPPDTKPYSIEEPTPRRLPVGEVILETKVRLDH